MRTVFPVGDPKAVKRFSALLMAEVLLNSYFSQKFTGKGMNNIIQEIDELESDAGDTVTFDLSVQLRNKPTRGDNVLEGKEEALKYYTDQVMIDQLRHAIDLGGRMSRKRVVHDQRMVGKQRGGEYWAQYMDQETFMTLSGGRGINRDFIEDTDYNGHAGNNFLPPDAQHTLYGGVATSKATLTVADKFNAKLVERVSTKASMLRAEDPETANMVPVTMEGAARYVIVMSEWQAYDLKTDVGPGNWLDFQKAAAGAEGSKNKIFRGNLGMINDVILHKHHHVVRFDDGGASADVEFSRALFMGRQAAVCAYGTPKGPRFKWEEEVKDYKNSIGIAAGVIFGMKKTRFNDRDFGVMSLDTAATNPNP